MTSQPRQQAITYIYCPVSHEVNQLDNDTWPVNRI